MRTAIARFVALALSVALVAFSQGNYGLPPHVYLFPVSPTATGEFRFLAGNSSSWVALRAPATVPASVPFVLPNSAGTAGQFLRNKGSGETEWANLPVQPAQITWSFIDLYEPLSNDLDVPYIYVNRARAFTITEVWCRNDAGTAVIQLQKNGSNVLQSDLTCSTSGASTTSFVSPEVAVGDRLGHVSVNLSGVKQLNVVVKYTPN